MLDSFFEHSEALYEQLRQIDQPEAAQPPSPDGDSFRSGFPPEPEPAPEESGEDPPQPESGQAELLREQLQELGTEIAYLRRQLQHLRREQAEEEREQRQTERRAAGPAAFFRGMGSTLVLTPLLTLCFLVGWKLLTLMCRVLDIGVGAALGGIAALCMGLILLAAAAPLGLALVKILSPPDEEDMEDW